jgi:hypothetical protein
MNVVSELIGGYTILTSQPQIEFENPLRQFLGPQNVADMTTLEIIDMGLVADNDWCFCG